MWACVASTSAAMMTRHLCRRTALLTRPVTNTSPLFASAFSTSQADGDSQSSRTFTTDKNRHLKSYHITGTSTSPASSSSSAVETHADNTPPKRPPRRQPGPGVAMYTVNTHHTIQTDIPTSMGGTNLAPQPVETLLAALLGCTQATAIFVARQVRLEIAKMDFDIQAVRDERGALQLPIDVTPDIPSRLLEITGRVTVWTAIPFTKEQLELLQEQTEARCPVANMMIASGCQMNVEWIQKQQPEQEDSETFNSK